MLDIPGWAALSIPTKGGLWTSWAAVSGEKLDKPMGLTNSVDVHEFARKHVSYLREPNGVDNWQKPSQTLLKKTGDCEDWAVLERALLLSVGYRERDIYILIAADLVAREDHAVVFVGDYYLDCRTAQVQHKSTFKDYRPVFAFQRSAAWTFGRKR